MKTVCEYIERYDMSKAKELWSMIKTKLDLEQHDWRTAHSSFDAAARVHSVKLGDSVREYRAALAEEANSAKPLPQACAERKGKPYAEEVSVFDASRSGQYMALERTDQIGRELPPSLDETELDGGTRGKHGSIQQVRERGPAPGRSEDSLHHTDRVVPCHDRPYIWVHRPPREGSAIHC